MTTTEHEACIRALQAALIAGEQSGKPRALNFETFKAQMRAKHTPPGVTYQQITRAE